MTDATMYVLELYRHFLDGHLPDPGGVRDQSSWLMAAFDIIRSNSAPEPSKRGH